MLTWWNELSMMQQIFGLFAIPATLVLIIQTVLFFFGIAGDSGDADVSQPDIHVNDLHPEQPQAYDGGMDSSDVDAIRLFTIRSIVAFFSIGGWTGLVLGGLKLPVPATIAISLMAGFLALYFVAWSIKMAFRMQSSGNVDLTNAVGKTGEVYITIPAANKGLGKITVTVQERFCEFEASTPIGRDLKTGEPVLIIGVQNEGLVVMPQEDNSIV